MTHGMNEHNMDAPVHPVPELYSGQQIAVEWGETLGDFYASAALIGILASKSNDTPENIAARCFEQAYFMCIERHKWVANPKEEIHR
jgi:hypothetical protein